MVLVDSLTEILIIPTILDLVTLVYMLIAEKMLTKVIQNLLEVIGASSCHVCEDFGYYQAECLTFLKRKKKVLLLLYLMKKHYLIVMVRILAGFNQLCEKEFEISEIKYVLK